MSSFLLLQQCPACLVRLILIVFVMGGRWPYSCCFILIVNEFFTFYNFAFMLKPRHFDWTHIHDGHSRNKTNIYLKQNIYFTDFFLKCKLCILVEFRITRIILISEKYLFVCHETFSLLTSVKHTKLIEEYVMCTEKQVLLASTVLTRNTLTLR